MNILITGATGFLGSALLDAALGYSQGNVVYAICRKKHQGQITFPDGVVPVWAEMEEYGKLDQLVQVKIDVFIHCAWAGADHEKRDDETVHADNLRQSLDAIRAAGRMGCKVFVMAGSQAEYGATNVQQTEEMECNPFTAYGKTKLEMLHQGKVLAESLGMRYVHLRIFSLYGAKDHPWSMIKQCLSKMMHNERVELSECAQNWNYLYVDDAARMIVALCEAYMQHPDIPSGIYNIASDDTRPLKAFVEEMRTMTQTKSELIYGAFKPNVIVALNPSIDKIKKLIRPSFVSFEKGVRNMMNTCEN